MYVYWQCYHLGGWDRDKKYVSKQCPTVGGGLIVRASLTFPAVQGGAGHTLPQQAPRNRIPALSDRNAQKETPGAQAKRSR